MLPVDFSEPPSRAGCDHRPCCSRRKYRSPRQFKLSVWAEAALGTSLRAPAALGTSLGAPIALEVPAALGRIAILGAPAALEKEAEAVVALCVGRRNIGSRLARDEAALRLVAQHRDELGAVVGF